MADEYIYVMHRMSRAYGPDRFVLRDITLALGSTSKSDGGGSPPNKTSLP